MMSGCLAPLRPGSSGSVLTGPQISFFVAVSKLRPLPQVLVQLQLSKGDWIADFLLRRDVQDASACAGSSSAALRLSPGLAAVRPAAGSHWCRWAQLRFRASLNSLTRYARWPGALLWLELTR